jgi:hypothetical protein
VNKVVGLDSALIDNFASSPGENVEQGRKHALAVRRMPASFHNMDTCIASAVDCASSGGRNRLFSIWCLELACVLHPFQYIR